MAVCVLGSINRDIVARVEALPRAGETVAASAVLRLEGGKGANQAVASARMGVATRMIGAVGDDADGAALTRYLAAEGIAIDAIVQRAGVATGAAYIALDARGENQIFIDAGANATLDAAVAAAIQPRDRVFLTQLEVPVVAIAAFFAAAGTAGGCRILNAAPALPEGVALLPDTDVMIFNQSELASYLGLVEAPQDAEDAVVARRLFSRPDQIAIVTLGARGAVLVSADDLVFVPGHVVPAIDTTGAGDCLCGVLAAAIAQGVPMLAALTMANRAAALCVGRIGAASAMPTRAEIKGFAVAT